MSKSIESADNINTNINSADKSISLDLINYVKNLKEAIEECDMLLIGIGSEMQSFTNKSVKESEFYNKHISQVNMDNMEKFEMLSKYVIAKNSPNVELYNQLSDYINKKNYFIISTNIDGCLGLSNINKKRIVTPCGNINQLQCNCIDENHIYSGLEKYEKCCSDILLDIPINEAIDTCFSICEDCNSARYPNIHKAYNYNENGYIKQWELYNKWLTATLNKKLVILELGEGFAMPGVIRWPFEKVAFVNNKAKLYRVNETLPQLPDNLADKGYALKVNSKMFLANLLL